MPDLESRLFQKYMTQGVSLVGVNPGGSAGTAGMASNEDPAVLAAYIKHLGLTFPIGIEETKTYITWTQLYKGINPFPVDIVVGKDGNIAYIAREYDPPSLMAAVQAELAK